MRRDSADAYSESNIAPGDAGPNGGFNEAWSPDLMSQNAPTGGYYPPLENGAPAQNTPPQVSQPTQQPSQPTANCVRRGSSIGGQGPYSVGQITSFSGYTVFYPREMANTQNCLFPWMIWGNGTTQKGIGYYGVWDQHLASWGIVVIHSHADGGGGLSGAGPMIGGVEVAKQLAGGQMRGKLTSKGGVAGHSQGGIGAHLTASKSNYIAAVVDLQGGGLATHSKPSLLLTGSTDFMRQSVYSAYNMLRGSAILYNYWSRSYYGPS